MGSGVLAGNGLPSVLLNNPSLTGLAVALVFAGVMLWATWPLWRYHDGD